MGKVSLSDHKISELFTVGQAAQILNRTEYSVWYHSTKNLTPPPVKKGRNLLLTKKQLLEIIEHMKLKEGESKENLTKKVKEAIAQ